MTRSSQRTLQQPHYSSSRKPDSNSCQSRKRKRAESTQQCQKCKFRQIPAENELDQSNGASPAHDTQFGTMASKHYLALVHHLATIPPEKLIQLQPTEMSNTRISASNVHLFDTTHARVPADHSDAQSSKKEIPVVHPSKPGKALKSAEKQSHYAFVKPSLQHPFGSWVQQECVLGENGVDDASSLQSALSGDDGAQQMRYEVLIGRGDELADEESLMREQEECALPMPVPLQGEDSAMLDKIWRRFVPT